MPLVKRKRKERRIWSHDQVCQLVRGQAFFGGFGDPQHGDFNEALCREAWDELGDDLLVEFIELPREVHPYYVATQAHPELRSRPTRSHPLFTGLIGAALVRQRETRLPEA